MSSVLASVLRRIFCRSPSLVAVISSSKLLLLLITSAICLFCCLTMLQSDERHYLPYSRQHQQPNQATNNTSRSRSLHYVGPAPLTEDHRDAAYYYDSKETLNLLLGSGSIKSSGKVPGGGSKVTRPASRNDLLGNLTSSEWSSVQRSRKARLREACASPSRNTDSLRECGFRLDGLLIDRSNYILYCAIPKVASSSVKLALAFMTGQINRTSSDVHYPVHISSWLRSVGIYSVDYLVENDPVWLKTAWSSLRKFVIVRHPFERLVSAYVDKFTLRNKFTDFFQRRFGRQIIRLYRNTSELRHKSAIDDAGHDVKFNEFVRFLTDKRIRCSQKLNPHWMSFVDVCHPCFVDYDYIVHFEGLASEMLHLWKAIYNRTSTGEVLQRRNVGQTRTSDLVAGYISRLRPEDVGALHELLSLDFKMFDYS